MLSESLQELLSAYVDGELSPTEYDRVMAALRESEIARDYVNSLRSMHAQFKAIPKVTCPPAITANLLKQQKASQLRMRSNRMAWGIGLAASVLIGLGTWWFIASQPSGGPVINQPDTIAKTVPTAPVPNNTIIRPNRPLFEMADVAPLVAGITTVSKDALDGLQARFSDTVNWLAEADTLREGRFLESQPTLLTSPVKQSGNLFKTIETSLPLQITPNELSMAEVQSRLQKKGAFVLDISARNNSKAFSRLVETAGFAISVDDEVKQKLDSKAAPTAMLYIDNITEEQLTAWLQKLRLADYWNVPEFRTDGTCRSLLLYPLEVNGQEQVIRSFGLSKWSAQKPEKDTKAGVALLYQPNRKTTSLSKETFKQICYLQGPAKDKLSLVIMIRAEKSSR